MIRKLLCAAAFAVLPVVAFSQSTDWKKRYESLVSKVGVSGVGVETVLNNWAKVDSTDVDLLIARFQYYFDKSKTTSIVQKENRKYLGAEPLLELKDSLGNNVYYFEEPVYEDSLIAVSFKYLDQAVSLYPDRLDLRLSRITSLMTYEKDSPDMAFASLSSLVDEDRSKHPQWVYPGETISEEDFIAVVQEYAFTFFRIGSPSSLSAFLKISEKMSGLYPQNTDFINNIGSYYMVGKDYKNAYKYFGKTLKIKPDDHTAILNCVQMAIFTDDRKAMKKYLPMMVAYGTEGEKLQAKARLDALNK